MIHNMKLRCKNGKFAVELFITQCLTTLLRSAEKWICLFSVNFWCMNTMNNVWLELQNVLMCLFLKTNLYWNLRAWNTFGWLMCITVCISQCSINLILNIQHFCKLLCLKELSVHSRFFQRKHQYWIARKGGKVKPWKLI